MRGWPLGLLVAACTTGDPPVDTACDLTDNDDGTYTLDCPDGTTSTLYGEDWQPPVDTAVYATEVVLGDVEVINQRDADDLAGVREITGNLLISSSVSIDLQPLRGLEVVGAGLYLDDTPWLTDLSFLRRLQTVGHELWIHDMDALTDLSALRDLQGVGGLSIIRNASLTSLEGLQGITSTTGGVFLGDNDALASLEGLSNLAHVGGDLELLVPGASTLDGLTSLRSVGGSLSVAESTLLTELDPLSGLQSVGGYLQIEANEALSDIAGLYGLEQVGDMAIFRDNPALCAWRIEAWYDALDEGSGLDLQDNDDTCEEAP